MRSKLSDAVLDPIYRKYTLLALLGWTLLVALLLAYVIIEHRQQDISILANQARASFSKDLLYRRWNARLGGVYAPVSDELRPNPYLAHVPERDITTSSGRKLTLVNPSYMTRQVHELQLRDDGTVSHITSLRPLRPENAPDPWERKALEQFNRGDREVVSVEQVGGEEHLRLMRPLRTEAPCLACHALQGYRVGDVLGGISVTLPVKAGWLQHDKDLIEPLIVFGTMWLAGIAVIAAGSAKLSLRSRALRDSEVRYRTLFDTIQDGIFQVDEQRNIRFINPAGARMLGYGRPDEAVGAPLSRHWQDYQDYVSYENDLAKQKRLALLLVNAVRLDGSRAIFELTARALESADGAVSGQEGIFRDITARIEAGIKAQELSKTMREILDHAPFGIYLVGEGGVIEYVNPAMLAIAGDNYEQFTEMNVLEFPNYRAIGLSDRIEKAFSGEYFRMEHIEYVSYFGNRRSIRNFIGIPITERGGRKVLMIVEDITHRVTAEERHEKLREQLVQAQKIESLGRLAGGVAHDFNNILSAIIGYSDLALRKLPEDAPVAKDIRIIRSSGERAAQVAHQLLAFSRKQVLEMRIVDVNALVANLAKMLSRLIGEDITFRILNGTAALNVHADPTQVEQVIINLMVNARDAMPKGGELILETGLTELTEADAQEHREIVPGRYVRIAVTDTGVGMPKAVQDRIFEPFFTTKEIGKGTGLGLATVYGIVKQHKGYIYVASEPHKGSTFTVYLPTEMTAGVSGVREERSVELPRGSGAVLVVEDDESVRSLVGEMIGTLGYTPIIARDSLEALEIVEKDLRPIELLLTDVVMPIMNGKDLSDLIRSKRPDIRTVFMSGYTEEVISRHGMLDPGILFIQKPVTPAKLAAKLSEALQPVPRDQPSHGSS